jgi:hypothetical protein
MESWSEQGAFIGYFFGVLVGMTLIGFEMGGIVGFLIFLVPWFLVSWYAGWLEKKERKLIRFWQGKDNDD